MKKAELEQQLQSMYFELQQTRTALENANKQLKQAEESKVKFAKESIKEFENTQFQQWKQCNEKFLSKFLTESLQKLQLSVKIESCYMDASLIYDNQIISTVTEYIDIIRNGLEE